MIFTFLTFLIKSVDYKIMFRVLATACWFVMSLFYQLTFPLVPAFGWIFFVLGLMFGVSLLRDFWGMWQKRKWG
jgi:hypothetical protein